MEPKSTCGCPEASAGSSLVLYLSGASPRLIGCHAPPPHLCSRDALRQKLFASMSTLMASCSRGQATGQASREKMSGRHMFLRSLMADVKTRLAQGQKMSPHLRQTVMKEHSSLFRTLSPAEQASWQAESQQEISRKRKAQQDEIQHLADALQLARERAGLGVASSGHLTAENCARFTQQDWEAVLSLSKSPEFAHAHVTALRRAAMTAPAAPPLQVQEALASIPVTAAAEVAVPQPRALQRWGHGLCVPL